MNLQCINREWVPERQGLMLLPDCERNNSTSILWSLKAKIFDYFSHMRTVLSEWRQLLIIQRLSMHKGFSRFSMSVGNWTVCNIEAKLQRSLFLLWVRWLFDMQVDLSEKRELWIHAVRCLHLLLLYGWIRPETSSTLRFRWEHIINWEFREN